MGVRIHRVPGPIKPSRVSKKTVERTAQGGRVVGFRDMTRQGLLKALATATGKRLAAIERELSRRGISRPDNRSHHTVGADTSDATHDGVDDHTTRDFGPLREHMPELPGYKVDALGRQRPDYSRPGRVSDVERITVSGDRIKRDAVFRHRVLARYGTACVICGYAVHVEAAHLIPKYELSDDRVENGAPLCPNHHWELDHGILSTDQVRRERDIRQVGYT